MRSSAWSSASPGSAACVRDHRLCSAGIVGIVGGYCRGACDGRAYTRAALAQAFSSRPEQLRFPLHRLARRGALVSWRFGWVPIAGDLIAAAAVRHLAARNGGWVPRAEPRRRARHFAVRNHKPRGATTIPVATPSRGAAVRPGAGPARPFRGSMRAVRCRCAARRGGRPAFRRSSCVTSAPPAAPRRKPLSTRLEFTAGTLRILPGRRRALRMRLRTDPAVHAVERFEPVPVSSAWREARKSGISSLPRPAPHGTITFPRLTWRSISPRRA